MLCWLRFTAAELVAATRCVSAAITFMTPISRTLSCPFTTHVIPGRWLVFHGVDDTVSVRGITLMGSHRRAKHCLPRRHLDVLYRYALAKDLKEIKCIICIGSEAMWINEPHRGAGDIHKALSTLVNRIRSNSLFIGDNLRGVVNDVRADCVFIFLFEVPLLFNREIVCMHMKCDVIALTGDSRPSTNTREQSGQR